MANHYEPWKHKNEKVDENYDGPKRQSNSPRILFGWDWERRYRFIKSFDMCKWLEKQIGRKWSDVYSELCEKYKKPEQRRIIDDHLFWVSLDATKKDGEFFDTKGDMLRWPNFAVVDDILYRPKKKTARWRQKDTEEQRNRAGVYHINGYAYALISEVWYELILAEVEKDHIMHLHDKFVGGYITTAQRHLYYGSAGLYCVGKRQLNSGEIKKLHGR